VVAGVAAVAAVALSSASDRVPAWGFEVMVVGGVGAWGSASAYEPLSICDRCGLRGPPAAEWPPGDLPDPRAEGQTFDVELERARRSDTPLSFLLGT
jgi:hypothetical protein